MYMLYIFRLIRKRNVDQNNMHTRGTDRFVVGSVEQRVTLEQTGVVAAGQGSTARAAARRHARRRARHVNCLQQQQAQLGHSLTTDETFNICTLVT